jgi:hypothetical protein
MDFQRPAWASLIDAEADMKLKAEKDPKKYVVLFLLISVFFWILM